MNGACTKTSTSTEGMHADCKYTSGGVPLFTDPVTDIQERGTTGCKKQIFV